MWLKPKKLFFGFLILFFYFLICSFSFAAITNNMNAIDQLGHYDLADINNPTPIYTKGSINDGPNRIGFSAPYGMAIDTTNHRLFVSETGNHRVLVYNLNNDNTFPDRIPDFVLGQPNFYTGVSNTSQSGFNQPSSLAYDSTLNYLFVADVNNNRVMVFDIATIVNGEDAVAVLGQADFITGFSQTLSAASIQAPQGLAVDVANRRLFVSDGFDSRVLVFNISAVTTNENAVNVLGSTDFVTNQAGFTQIGMSQTAGLAYDPASQRLFVANRNAHRVMVFDVNTIVDGEAAINVIGQTTFTANTGATAQNRFRDPLGLTLDTANQRLFVSETTNNRVTVFNVATTTLIANTPATDGPNAVNVIGNTVYTTITPGTSATLLGSLADIMFDNTTNRLFVAQVNNNRVSIFDTASITDGEAATDLIGQYDENYSNLQPIYTKSLASNGPNKFGFSLAGGSALDSLNHKFYQVDANNHRVLVYNLNTNNSFPDRIPDFVIGQPNFYTNTFAVSQTAMRNPSQVAVDMVGNRLFVSQGANSRRVTVYDTSALANGMAASFVLGQVDFISLLGATSQAGMSTPEGLAFDSVNNRLYVVDTTSNRVTVYDTTTIVNGEPAVALYGQPDFTTAFGSTSINKMNAPYAVALDTTNNKLYVSQTGAHRITVYSTTGLPLVGPNAIAVLGQTNFTNATAATAAGRFFNPRGLGIDIPNQKLFVSDSSNRRVLGFDVSTIVNGENAVNVLGQTNFTSSLTTSLQSSIQVPFGLHYNPFLQQIFVSNNNHRVSVFNISPTDPGFTIAETSGSTVATENGTGDNFTVVLTKAPTGNVVLNITSSISATSANISPTTLTFTTANWNIPQTVTITAPEEFNSISETGTVTVAVNVASSATEYASVTSQNVTLNIVDNDTAGFVVSVLDDLTNESGNTGSFTIVLTSQPTADVTIPIISNDLTEGTVSPNLLTFTSVNWNTPQTVTVTGVDDVITDGPISFTIVTSDPSSTDNQYNSLVDSNVADVTMQNQDNENPSFNLIISNSTTTEAGGTATIQFQLAGQPAGGADVTIPLTISDTSEGLFSGGLSTTSITILNANWNTPSANVITIVGVDDSIFDGNISYIVITGKPVSADPVWDNLLSTDIADPLFINTDNEVPAPPAVAPTTTTNTNNGLVVSFTCQDKNAINYTPVNLQYSLQNPDHIVVNDPSLCLYKKEIDKNILQQQTNLNFTKDSCIAFSTYARIGTRGSQVIKIKKFLNIEMKSNLNASSNLFDKDTDRIVKDFQRKYVNEILIPWGHKIPTGYWYKTTTKQANKIIGCN